MLSAGQLGWSTHGETPLAPFTSIYLVSTRTLQKWRSTDEINHARSWLLHPALCKTAVRHLRVLETLLSKKQWPRDSHPCRGFFSLVPNSSGQLAHSLWRRNNTEQKVLVHTGETQCFQGHCDRAQARHAQRVQSWLQAGCAQVSRQAGRPGSLHGHRPSRSCSNSPEFPVGSAKPGVKITEQSTEWRTPPHTPND